MIRPVGWALALCAWLGWLAGMAHLCVAADRNHAGELGQGLDLTITGARCLAAALLPCAAALVLLLRRQRAAVPAAAPSPPAWPEQPLQLSADRPGGVPVSALVPWHRPPPVRH